MFGNTNADKIMGGLIVTFLIINFFFIIYIGITVHSKYNQLEKNLVELNTQIIDLEKDVSNAINQNNIKAHQDNVNKDTIEFLKEEFNNYRDFANNDRESFFNLVSMFFVALGVLVTGGTIVLYWIFGQTKTEIKENADLTIRASINEIEHEAKEKVKDLINPKIKEYEEKYSELERFLENQHSLRKSRVLILCPKNLMGEMNNLEVSRLIEFVDKVNMLNLDSLSEFERRVKNREVDIIIYRYELNGEEQEETIRTYIQKLQGLNLKIPLIVYATFGNRVTGKDLNIVNSYPYSVMANMPTSLTSNIISLANIIPYERR